MSFSASAQRSRFHVASLRRELVELLVIALPAVIDF